MIHRVRAIAEARVFSQPAIKISLDAINQSGLSGFSEITLIDEVIVSDFDLRDVNTSEYLDVDLLEDDDSDLVVTGRAWGPGGDVYTLIYSPEASEVASVTDSLGLTGMSKEALAQFKSIMKMLNLDNSEIKSSVISDRVYRLGTHVKVRFKKVDPPAIDGSHGVEERTSILL